MRIDSSSFQVHLLQCILAAWSLYRLHPPLPPFKFSSIIFRTPMITLYTNTPIHNKYIQFSPPLRPTYMRRIACTLRIAHCACFSRRPIDLNGQMKLTTHDPDPYFNSLSPFFCSPNSGLDCLGSCASMTSGRPSKLQFNLLDERLHFQP